MINKVQQFWNEHAEWSQQTFGLDTERGCIGPLRHLEKEAKEAYTETNLEARDIEIADCLLLTFDAARRNGMTLDSLMETCFNKLEVNKKRNWSIPIQLDLPVEHI